MNITYQKPGIDYMIESILQFQSDDETAFWSDSLYYFYPQLDKEKSAGLSFEDRKKYIGETIRAVYKETEGELEQKAAVYNRYWQEHQKQVEQALSEAFETDCAALFNELVCKVSLNPVSPRFLEEKYFEVFYKNSERGALGVSLHEIIHFVWFYVWNQIFQDSYGEYERPSLKWILSEMVVESIMKDSRLSSLNPYFPRERGGCIYPYFFDMEAGGKPVLEVIDGMYQTYAIKDFMKNSYAFCMEHEAEIRRHIVRSEQVWT